MEQVQIQYKPKTMFADLWMASRHAKRTKYDRVHAVVLLLLPFAVLLHLIWWPESLVLPMLVLVILEFLLHIGFPAGYYWIFVRQREKSGTTNDPGVHWIEEWGTAHLSMDYYEEDHWSVYDDATIKENWIFLSRQHHTQLFARRWFASDADWAQVKELVAAKVPSAKRQAPVADLQSPLDLPDWVARMIGNTDIDYAGTLENSDFKRAIEIHSSGPVPDPDRKPTKVSPIAYVGWILILAMIPVFLLMVDAAGTPSGPGNGRVFMLVFLIACVLVGALVSLLWRSKRNELSVRPSLPVSCGCSAEGMVWHTPNSLGVYRYSFFNIYRQADDMLLLYANINAIFPIPRRFVDDENWEPLRKMIDHEIKSLQHQRDHCAECGKARPKSEMIVIGETMICKDCKATYIQRLKEGV